MKKVASVKWLLNGRQSRRGLQILIVKEGRNGGHLLGSFQMKYFIFRPTLQHTQKTIPSQEGYFDVVIAK